MRSRAKSIPNESESRRCRRQAGHDGGRTRSPRRHAVDQGQGGVRPRHHRSGRGSGVHRRRDAEDSSGSHRGAVPPRSDRKTARGRRGAGREAHRDAKARRLSSASHLHARGAVLHRRAGDRAALLHRRNPRRRTVRNADRAACCHLGARPVHRVGLHRHSGGEAISEGARRRRRPVGRCAGGGAQERRAASPGTSRASRCRAICSRR